MQESWPASRSHHCFHKNRVLTFRLTAMYEDDSASTQSSESSNGSQDEQTGHGNTQHTPQQDATEKACPLSVEREVVIKSRPKAATAASIRSRFLFSLGISEKEKMMQNASRSKRDEVSPRTIRRKRSPSFQEALKGDFGQPSEDDETSLTLTTASGTSSSSPLWSAQQSSSWLSFLSEPGGVVTGLAEMNGKSPHQGVSFDACVTVHPIPNRDAYSDRIKKLMWQSSAEMQENAARNCFEFASEGWDWQNVASDEEMILTETGERIHPVHFLCLE